MAKTILLDVLDGVIGQYVRGFDAEHLSIALWKGKIELKSLELNTNEINKELSLFSEDTPDLAVPFRVLNGSVDKILLEVPWTNLSGKPLIFKASGLKIAIEPYDHLSHNQQGEDAQSRLDLRKQFLELRESRRKNLNLLRKLSMIDGAEIQGDSSKSKKQDGFRQRMIQLIIENLQLEIEDIHIEVKDHRFEAGLYLKSLSLLTTDHLGNRKFIDRSEDKSNNFLYKELELSNFNIYLDKKQKSFSSDKVKNSHSNVLGPLFFKAKLRKSDDEVVSLSVPKYQLNFELPVVSLNISRDHIDVMKTMQRTIRREDATMSPLFPEYRPTVPISKNTAKLWWKYAVRSVGRLTHRTSWKEYFLAYQKRKKYILLYKRHAHHLSLPNYVSLSGLEERELFDIDHDKSISVKVIMLWRNFADASADIDKERAPKSKKQYKKVKLSLFRKKKSSKKDKDDSIIPLSFEDLKAISLDNDNSIRDDVENFKKFDLSFVIREVEINLLESMSKPILSLQISTLKTNFQANADGSYKFKQILDDFLINDLITIDPLFNQMVKTSRTSINMKEKSALVSSEGNSHVCDIIVSKSQDDSIDITVNIRSFEIALHPFILKKIQGTFLDKNEHEKESKKESHILSPKLGTATQSRTDKLYSSVSNIIEQRKNKKASINLTMDIDAPIILLPLNSVDKNTDVIVMDLGSLKANFGLLAESSTYVNSWFQKKEDIEAKDSVDFLSININDISLELCRASESKQKGGTMCAQLCEAEKVILPICLSLTFGIGNTDSIAGKVCSYITIDEIGINLSANKINKLSCILTVWRSALQPNSNESIYEKTESNEGIVNYETVIEVIEKPDAVNYEIVENDPEEIIEYDSEEKYHFSGCLKYLYIALDSQILEKVESEIANVSTSFTVYDDASSKICFKMGSFWILDGLEKEQSRKQRILAHSGLPIESFTYGENNKANLRSLLNQMADPLSIWAGESNLADITIRLYSSDDGIDQLDKNKSPHPFTTVIDMNFFSLYINFNPSATQNASLFLKTLKDSYSQAVEKMTNKNEREKAVFQSNNKITMALREKMNRSTTSLRLNACLSSFDVCVRSGKTDDELINFQIFDVKADYTQKMEEGRWTTTFSTLIQDCLCDTKAMAFFLKPVRLIGPITSLQSNEVEKDNMVNLAFKITDNKLQVHVAIGEIEQLVFPELEDILRELLDSFPNRSPQSKNETQKTFKKSFAKDETDTEGTSFLRVAQKTHISLNIEKYRLKIFGIPPGIQRALYSKKSNYFGGSEGVVMETACKIVVYINQNIQTQTIRHGSFQMNLEGIEIYTSTGNSVQILDPFGCSLKCTYVMRRKLLYDMEFKVLSPFSFDISIQDIALFHRLLTSFDKLNKSTSQQNIKEISTDGTTELSSSDQKHSQSKNSSLLLKVTIPESKLTVMNDLLGSDSAIFKVALNETTFEVEALSLHSNFTDLDDMMFYIKLKTNLLAEYFHPKLNMWEPLLLEPCKIKFTGSRGDNKEANTSRLYTSFGIQLTSFHMLFSDQFLTNIGLARRMWVVYSEATKRVFNEIDTDDHIFDNDLFQTYARKSSANYMIKSVLSLHPYEVNNLTTRDIQFQVKNDVMKYFCVAFGKCGFRFAHEGKKGHGGKRLYGQDSDELKSVTINFDDKDIHFDHIDKELNNLAYPHHLGDNNFIFTQVDKIGTRTRITLRTPVKIENCTGIPVEVYVEDDILLGCVGKQSIDSTEIDKEQNFISCLGIPASYLNYESNTDSNLVTMSIKPVITGINTGDTCGKFNIPSLQEIDNLLKKGKDYTISEIVCSPKEIVLQVLCKFTKTRNNYTLVDVFIQPRVIFQNLMPTDIFIQVSQGFVFPTAPTSSDKMENEFYHELRPLGTVELFSSFSEICMNIKCSYMHAGGDHLGCLSLSQLFSSGKESDSDENEKYFSFPLSNKDGNILNENGLICLISEVKNLYSSQRRMKTHGVKFENDFTDLSHLSHDFNVIDAVQKFQLKVPNIAVDHTCKVLIKPVESDVLSTIRDGFLRKSTPACTLTAFWSSNRRQKITLLPNSKDKIRIAIQGRNGTPELLSTPFSIENIVLKEGGVDFSRIPMETTSNTALYAYRKLSRHYNNELHIVNEYSIYNSNDNVWVSVMFKGGRKMTILPKNDAPLTETENVRFQITGNKYGTDYLNIRLGTNIYDLKSNPLDDNVGSITIETTLAEINSRFVVKIGRVRLNDDSTSTTSQYSKIFLFPQDILRFSFKWQKLQISLCRSKSTVDDGDKNILREILNEESRTKFSKRQENQEDIFNLYTRVAHILLDDMMIDYQRMFRETVMNQSESNSIPHSQFVCMINKAFIMDYTLNTLYPVVLNTDNSDSPLFKLVIKTRENEECDYTDVELVDLKLCHSDSGISDRIIFSTSEQFIWNLLDMYTDIINTASEVNSLEVKLSADDENSLSISIVSSSEGNHNVMYHDEEVFTAPSSKNIWKINKATISPISLEISFKRFPDPLRYNELAGATIVNYFIKNMKFSINKAKVNFSGYILNEFKGPRKDFFSLIRKFYRSELSYKVITLLSSASLEEWDTLTGRQDGKTEYVEGDELRMLGNLVGKTANFLLTGTGEGIGIGVDFLATTIGSGIKAGATAVGAESAGEGVEGALTGAGKNVSDGVKGIGAASGKVLHGVGKGVGSAAGGVGGGLYLTLQGKLNEGAQSASGGFETGLETVTQDFTESAKEVSDSASTASKSCCTGCSSRCSKGCQVS